MDCCKPEQVGTKEYCEQIRAGGATEEYCEQIFEEMKELEEKK